MEFTCLRQVNPEHSRRTPRNDSVNVFMKRYTGGMVDDGGVGGVKGRLMQKQESRPAR